MNKHKKIQVKIIKYALPAIAMAFLFLLYRPIKKSLSKEKTKTISSENKKSFIDIEYLKGQLEKGIQLKRSENPEKEIELYNELLKEKQVFSFLHSALGRAYYNLNKFEDSEKQFKEAVILNPTSPSSYTFLSMALRKQKKTKEALEEIKKAYKLSPKSFDVNLQMSKAYYFLNQFDEALKYGIAANTVKPNDIHAMLNLGYINNKKGNIDQAINMYKKVLLISPKLANAHYNLGYSLKIKGETEEALKCLSKAIELDPHYFDAHIARAQAHISLENFEEGWEEYEWRWSLFGIEPLQYKDTMWDGSNIRGKTIILYTEQGLGDTIQFIRLAKNVKEMGAKKVVCKVQKPLVKLLSACPFVDEILPTNAETHKYDTHAHLMSLPRILKIKPDKIPAEMPYLVADPKLEKEWKEKLDKDKNFKVGLCWHVDPVHEKDKSPWSLRSIDLEQFAPLAKLKNVSFYCLQKLKDDSQIINAPKGFTLHTFGPDFDSKNGAFMDSAAIIKNLDLVITVDTCIAHLAGGLNKPVWMFLPYAPDCRWYKDGEKTPWYPTMKLFRAKTPQKWNDPIAEIATALKKEIQKNTTT